MPCIEQMYIGRSKQQHMISRHARRVGEWLVAFDQRTAAASPVGIWRSRAPLPTAVHAKTTVDLHCFAGGREHTGNQGFRSREHVPDRGIRHPSQRQTGGRTDEGDPPASRVNLGESFKYL